MDYLLLLCFCLLKQETTLIENLTTYSFNEFILEKDFYENICAQKLLSDSAVSNFKKSEFDKCINHSSDNFKPSTIIIIPDKNLLNKSRDLNQEYNNFSLDKTTIILIVVYSLTVFVSVVGNTLLIIVMFCGYRSSLLDISIFLLNLGLFNLLM